MEIEEKYLEQLKELCDHFKLCKKCKDHDKLCFLKKRTWSVAKLVYAKRVKEGKINGCD